jgi:hypothetical protein
MRTDFQQIIASPISAYDEGLRFFMGEGILNETLRRVTKDLEKHQIDYTASSARLRSINTATGVLPKILICF